MLKREMKKEIDIEKNEFLLLVYLDDDDYFTYPASTLDEALESACVLRKTINPCGLLTFKVLKLHCSGVITLKGDVELE